MKRNLLKKAIELNDELSGIETIIDSINENGNIVGLNCNMLIDCLTILDPQGLLQLLEKKREELENEIEDL